MATKRPNRNYQPVFENVLPPLPSILRNEISAPKASGNTIPFNGGYPIQLLNNPAGRMIQEDLQQDVGQREQQPYNLGSNYRPSIGEMYNLTPPQQSVDVEALQRLYDTSRKQALRNKALDAWFNTGDFFQSRGTDMDRYNAMQNYALANQYQVPYQLTSNPKALADILGRHVSNLGQQALEEARLDRLKKYFEYTQPVKEASEIKTGNIEAQRDFENKAKLLGLEYSLKPQPQSEYGKTLERKQAEADIARQDNLRRLNASLSGIDYAKQLIQQNPQAVNAYAPIFRTLGRYTGGNVGMSKQDLQTRGEIVRTIGEIKNGLIAQAKAGGQSGINTMAEINQATAGIDENSSKEELMGALNAMTRSAQRLQASLGGVPTQSFTQPQVQRVRVKSPSGKVGSIPSNQLQEALSKGYTRL